MLQTAIAESLIKDLSKIVGEKYVSTTQADLYIYARDLTQAEPHQPDIVVLPANLEEVQAVLRLANREKIPVTPYVAGGNIGGVAIPLEGGILLDLKRMDRILEINETDMYALVEPGVTFGMLKACLEKDHPGLVYTYAFSPPSTGVITNALLQGLDNLSFRYGAASHWVSGLEVARADGELVKIGSSAVSDTWQAIAPMPELSGLFLGWQGTTGIITKMAVSLWPKPAFAANLHFTLQNMEDAGRLFQTIARTRIPDDLIGTSFALSKVSQLAMNHLKGSLYPAVKRQPGEPEFTISTEVSGNTRPEMNAKIKALKEIISRELSDMEISLPPASPSTYAGFPMQALGVLSGGGGLTWVGCYGPMSRWAETAEKGNRLQDKYDLSRSCYTRIMNEGHFVGLRWMLPYDKGNPDIVRRVEALCVEQLELALEMGYIPYKTPVWAVRELEKRASPAWLKLHRQVKQLLDPNNILNPGRWGAPEE